MSYVRMFLALVLVAGCSSPHKKHRDVAPEPPKPLKVSISKKLVYCGWFGNTIPSPTFIQTNWTFLQSQPFDGYAVYLRNGANMFMSAAIQKPVAVPLTSIQTLLAPMQGLAGHHFALVQGSSPPDFFDDAGWAVTVENWRRLAQVCLEVGLVGIVFDNEQYHKPWGNWVAGGAHTLPETQAQAVLRGQAVMEAVQSAFPSIAVLTLHGPSVSRTDAPPPLFPQWQGTNELLGAYFEGFLVGSVSPSKVIDGGELYTCRTPAQFLSTYDWRRLNWPTAALSYGVYDKPFQGAAMDVAILRPTLTNAIMQADEYTWLYAEGPTFLKTPATGGATQEWLDAVKGARIDAGM